MGPDNFRSTGVRISDFGISAAIALVMLCQQSQRWQIKEGLAAWVQRADPHEGRAVVSEASVSDSVIILPITGVVSSFSNVRY